MTEFDSGISQEQVGDASLEKERSQSRIDDEVCTIAWLKRSLGEEPRLDLIRHQVRMNSGNGDAKND